MRKYFPVVIATMLALGLSAFTPKPFTSRTFYYIKGTCTQRLETGFIFHFCAERTISSSNYTNISNWTETSQGADTYNESSPDGSSYVKSITIPNYEPDQDGDDDGLINLQEALTGVFAYFTTNGVYPSTSTTVNVDANLSGGTSTVTNLTRAENAN